MEIAISHLMLANTSSLCMLSSISVKGFSVCLQKWFHVSGMQWIIIPLYRYMVIHHVSLIYSKYYEHIIPAHNKQDILIWRFDHSDSVDMNTKRELDKGSLCIAREFYTFQGIIVHRICQFSWLYRNCTSTTTEFCQNMEP